MKRIILSIVVAVTVVTAAAAQQAPAPDRGPILSVKGEGKVEVKPEFAEFWATVSVTEPSLEAATAALPEKAARANALLKSLANDGLEIRRSNYALHENRPFSNQPLPAGTKLPNPTFVASIQYQLRMRRLDAINDIYSRVNTAGLFEISGRVSFDVQDQREPLNLARKSAYADALAQGQAYADAANINLSQVIEIIDGEARPDERGEADLARPASGTVRIDIIPPATLTYTASVNVTWKISPRN